MPFWNIFWMGLAGGLVSTGFMWVRQPPRAIAETFKRAEISNGDQLWNACLRESTADACAN